MSLFLKRAGSSSNRGIAPEGLYDAVCADVIDLGLVQTAYGEKQQLQIIWELVDDTNTVYQLSKRYTASLHEKSKLFQDLKSWRGAEWSAEELSRGFDVESLVGKCCQILVTHLDREGTSYAVVDKILKAKRKIALSGNYDKESTRLRMLDRVIQQQHQMHSADIKKQMQAATAPTTFPKTSMATPMAVEKDEIPF